MQSDNLIDLVAPDGDYELVRGLGQPGTEVFQARSRDGRELVLRIWRSESELDTRSAIEVATAACSVRHPMLASMFEVREDSDRTVRLIAEYVPGRNLAEWISMAGLPPLTMAVDFVKRLALALHFAHQRGVSHHAVHPGNIVIAEPQTKPGNRIIGKLLDLGVARAMRPAPVPFESGHYAAPEALLAELQKPGRGAPANAVMNVYSCGALLHLLTTGHPPFESESLEGLSVLHTAGVTAAPSRINRDIPDNLQRVILQALERDPRKRIASGASFAASLSNVESVWRHSGVRPRWIEPPPGDAALHGMHDSAPTVPEFDLVLRPAPGPLGSRTSQTLVPTPRRTHTETVRARRSTPVRSYNPTERTLTHVAGLDAKAIRQAGLKSQALPPEPPMAPRSTTMSMKAVARSALTGEAGRPVQPPSAPRPSSQMAHTPELSEQGESLFTADELRESEQLLAAEQAKRAGLKEPSRPLGSTMRYDTAQELLGKSAPDAASIRPFLPDVPGATSARLGAEPHAVRGLQPSAAVGAEKVGGEPVADHRGAQKAAVGEASQEPSRGAAAASVSSDLSNLLAEAVESVRPIAAELSTRAAKPIAITAAVIAQDPVSVAAPLEAEAAQLIAPHAEPDEWELLIARAKAAAEAEQPNPAVAAPGASGQFSDLEQPAGSEEFATTGQFEALDHDAASELLTSEQVLSSDQLESIEEPAASQAPVASVSSETLDHVETWAPTPQPSAAPSKSAADLNAQAAAWHLDAALVPESVAKKAPVGRVAAVESAPRKALKFGFGLGALFRRRKAEAVKSEVSAAPLRAAKSAEPVAPVEAAASFTEASEAAPRVGPLAVNEATRSIAEAAPTVPHVESVATRGAAAGFAEAAPTVPHVESVATRGAAASFTEASEAAPHVGPFAANQAAGSFAAAAETLQLEPIASSDAAASVAEAAEAAPRVGPFAANEATMSFAAAAETPQIAAVAASDAAIAEASEVASHVGPFAVHAAPGSFAEAAAARHVEFASSETAASTAAASDAAPQAGPFIGTFTEAPAASHVERFVATFTASSALGGHVEPDAAADERGTGGQGPTGPGDADVLTFYLPAAPAEEDYAFEEALRANPPDAAVDENFAESATASELASALPDTNEWTDTPAADSGDAARAALNANAASAIESTNQPTDDLTYGTANAFDRATQGDALDAPGAETWTDVAASTIEAADAYALSTANDALIVADVRSASTSTASDAPSWNDPHEVSEASSAIVAAPEAGGQAQTDQLAAGDTAADESSVASADDPWAAQNATSESDDASDAAAEDEWAAALAAARSASVDQAVTTAAASEPAAIERPSAAPLDAAPAAEVGAADSGRLSVTHWTVAETSFPPSTELEAGKPGVLAAPQLDSPSPKSKWETTSFWKARKWFVHSDDEAAASAGAVSARFTPAASQDTDRAASDASSSDPAAAAAVSVVVVAAVGVGSSAGVVGAPSLEQPANLGADTSVEARSNVEAASGLNAASNVEAGPNLEATSGLDAASIREGRSNAAASSGLEAPSNLEAPANIDATPSDGPAHAAARSHAADSLHANAGSEVAPPADASAHPADPSPHGTASPAAAAPLAPSAPPLLGPASVAGAGARFARTLVGNLWGSSSKATTPAAAAPTVPEPSGVNAAPPFAAHPYLDSPIAPRSNVPAARNVPAFGLDAGRLFEDPTADSSKRPQQPAATFTGTAQPTDVAPTRAVDVPPPLGATLVSSAFAQPPIEPEPNTADTSENANTTGNAPLPLAAAGHDLAGATDNRENSNASERSSGGPPPRLEPKTLVGIGTISAAGLALDNPSTALVRDPVTPPVRSTRLRGERRPLTAESFEGMLGRPDEAGRAKERGRSKERNSLAAFEVTSPTNDFSTTDMRFLADIARLDGARRRWPWIAAAGVGLGVLVSLIALSDNPTPRLATSSPQAPVAPEVPQPAAVPQPPAPAPASGPVPEAQPAAAPVPAKRTEKPAPAPDAAYGAVAKRAEPSSNAKLDAPKNDAPKNDAPKNDPSKLDAPKSGASNAEVGLSNAERAKQRRAERLADKMLDSMQVSTDHLAAPPTRSFEPVSATQAEAAYGRPREATRGAAQAVTVREVWATPGVVTVVDLKPLPLSNRIAESTAVPVAGAGKTVPGVSTEVIEIRGSLSDMRVRRAIERLHPQFSGCFQQHPPAAAESVRRIELTIDETGRARDAHTQGASDALAECLTNASRKISAGVPDTGVVKVSWNVRYTR